MTTEAKPPRRSRTAPRGDGPVRAARETTSAATGQAEASTAKRAPGRPAGTGKGLLGQTRTRPLLVHLGPVERERIAAKVALYGASSK